MHMIYKDIVGPLLASIAAITASAIASSACAQVQGPSEVQATPDEPRPRESKAVELEAKSAPDQSFALHAQTTLVVQNNRPFRSAFSGQNSLQSNGETRETFDVTLYLGVRPWKGAELWINPEIDQGFGLRNTLGAAGFPNGEAYKVGRANPYTRLPRLFFRQTIDLGGEVQKVAADLNQLRTTRTANHFVITLGKFGVADVFDTNVYAHDPRGDFLNWSIIEAGNFDYAADAWGYTVGGAVELYAGRFALRGGLFNLSEIPNGEILGKDFRQYEAVGEIEERHTVHGHAGKIKLTAYFNHGNMGRLSEATAIADATGQPADVAQVRKFATRAGVSINVEQELSDSVGVFLRAGISDGRFEAFEFTDIDRTLSGGVSITGKNWGRPDDHVGLAFVANQASRARLRYLAAGGLGVLVGDGQLLRPSDEHIVETYYDFAIAKGVHLSPDFQLIVHPAYNKDRGPVPILAARFHAQF